MDNRDADHRPYYAESALRRSNPRARTANTAFVRHLRHLFIRVCTVKIRGLDIHHFSSPVGRVVVADVSADFDKALTWSLLTSVLI